jgi:uncharacterized repeat protein (TIGR01451 family)
VNMHPRIFALVALTATSLVTSARALATDFGPPRSYPVGTNPVAIVSGDFNGDGKLDLAVLNNSSGDVSVLLGNGDGTFKAAITATISRSGSGPTAIVAGDFNGDKKLDIVVINSGDPQEGTPGLMNLLLGNGNGTFQPPIQIQAGKDPFSLTVADLNGDNKLDLIVGDHSNASLTILLGKGDGTFLAPATISLDGVPSTPTGVLSIIAGDFNGDGKLDLVAGVSGEPLSILIGAGDGSFQAPVQIGSLIGGWLLDGDFDGDHRLDLVVRVPKELCGQFGCHTFYYTKLLLGVGDGTFAVPIPVAAAGFSGGNIASADFNADDKLDLYSDGLHLGDNSGAFVSFPLLLATNESFAIAGDFNGDNLPDLAVTDDTNNAVVVALNASPTSGADLAVSVNPTQANITIGTGDLQYVATLFNGGPQDASGVTLTETLPASWKLESAQPSQGTCSGTTTIICNLGSMADPSTASVQFNVTPTASGTFSDSLIVAATQPDLNMKNNSASITATISSPADIAVSGTASETTGSIGDKVTYAITVSNGGPASATNVSLADSLSDNLPVSSLTATQGSCTTAPSSITCALGTLPSGGSTKVTFAITLQTDEVFTNSLSISADQPDPNPANNSAVVSVTVNPADLAVVQTESPNSVAAGTRATYTIKVSNGGPAKANNVMLTDTLPQNVPVSAASASQGSCTAASNGLLNCSLGALAAAATATVTLSVTPTAAGPMTNTVSVAANEPDPNASNNSAALTTNVSGAPDFSLSANSPVVSGTRSAPITDQIIIAYQKSFSSAIALTCSVSGPAPMVTCSLSPASIPAGAKTPSSILTIKAPATSALFLPQGSAWPARSLGILFLQLAGTAFLAIGVSPDKSRRRLRQTWVLCGLVLALCALGAGCSSGGPSSSTYVVTVNATSGPIQHSTNVTVTVQ